jgi:phytoene dehydrogenase-like protein
LTTEKATPVSPKPYKKNQEEEPREESKTQAPDFFEPDSPHFSTPDSSSAAKKKTKRTAREIDESFAEFWRAYPKRVEKEAARKAFAAAIKRGVAPELMIEGAKRYTVERSGQEAKYTKHPARWLNAGCYADEPSAAAGAVIDQHGNLVAAIEPQQAAQPRGSVVAVAEALAEHLEKHGGDF